jgi:photosystem II stability/assembly factor-like uncharacterized protein
MKTIINVCILVCMISLAGCGEGENVPKMSGVVAGTIVAYNGSSWSSPASGTSNQLNNVTFGNSLFVAVGSSGTIQTSSDGGATWISQHSGTSLSLYGVTFGKDANGNGLFVAVGDFGIILSSSDGISWTQPVPGNINSVPLNGVTYGNGQFVAVGYSGIMYSSDGANWKTIGTAPSGITGPTVDLYSVTFGKDANGNPLFVTVGTYNSSSTNQPTSYNGIIGTSPDGINWTIVQYPSNYLSGVAFNGANQFVAVGREGIILTSPDGSNWTPQAAAPIANSTFTPYLINVIYTGTQYVAVGNYVGTTPSTGFILTSPDGINWTMPSTGSTSDLYGVCFGDGEIVAVGGE